MGVRVAGLLVDVAVGVVICVGVGEHADSATNIRTSRMISERFMLASILPQTGKTVPDLSDTKAAPLDREIYSQSESLYGLRRVSRSPTLGSLDVLTLLCKLIGTNDDAASAGGSVGNWKAMLQFIVLETLRKKWLVTAIMAHTSRFLD
jgi:hypothetical protein